jgi:hypothetical protein
MLLPPWVVDLWTSSVRSYTPGLGRAARGGQVDECSSWAKKAGAKARHGQHDAKSGTKQKARDVAVKKGGVSHTPIDEAVKLAQKRPDLHQQVEEWKG